MGKSSCLVWGGLLVCVCVCSLAYRLGRFLQRHVEGWREEAVIQESDVNAIEAAEAELPLRMQGDVTSSHLLRMLSAIEKFGNSKPFGFERRELL